MSEAAPFRSTPPSKIPSEERALALAAELGIPLVHPSLMHAKPGLAATIPEELARRIQALPVLVTADATLWLAMVDPTDRAALAECAAASKMRTRAMVASSDEIAGSMHRWYGGAAPKPPPPPPRRQISVLELDVADIAPDSEPPATPTPAPVIPRPPRVLVIQGSPDLARACRSAFAEKGLAAEQVAVEEADLVDAPRAAREGFPFAIVVPEDIYGFDPSAFETLALGSRALLVTAMDGDATHLGPVLKTAFKRLFD